MVGKDENGSSAGKPGWGGVVNEASTERCEQCVSRAVRGVFTRPVPAPPRHLEGAASAATRPPPPSPRRRLQRDRFGLRARSGHPPSEATAVSVVPLVVFAHLRRAFHVCVGRRRGWVERRVTDRSPAPSRRAARVTRCHRQSTAWITAGFRSGRR